MPSVTAEVLGLLTVVAIVALLTRLASVADARRQRRGRSPLGFASERTLEKLHRQLDDAPPSHLVGGRVTAVGDRPPGRRYGDVYVGLQQDGGDL